MLHWQLLCLIGDVIQITNYLRVIFDYFLFIVLIIINLHFLTRTKVREVKKDQSLS